MFILFYDFRYLAKDMGYKVCDDPLTVKLKFEPTGKLKYYLTLKENICVVCGMWQGWGLSEEEYWCAQRIQKALS